MMCGTTRRRTIAGSALLFFAAAIGTGPSVAWSQNATGTGGAERAALSPAEAEHQAYWYARYNLNAMLLMAGPGVRMAPPPEKVERLAEIAGFDLAQLPKNPFLLRAMYAGGDPHFQQPGSFSDLSTLRWDRSTLVKRFEPAAQAFTIVKVVSEDLRTAYHEYPKDRFIALVELQEAKAMADFMAQELTGANGLVAPKPEGGSLAEPRAYDQAAALWAYSALADALRSPDLPLYSQLPDAAADAERYAGHADALFRSMARLHPAGARDLALTIQAYGRYAVATRNAQSRSEAQARVAALARQLMQAPRPKLDDLAFATYGLGEAAQLSGDPTLSTAARRIFFGEMEPLWDPEAGVYAPEAGARRYVYTPERTAAVLAAIHTIRRSYRPGTGEPGGAERMDRRYREFFENAVVRSGMQQAHAIPLAVHPAYLEREPRSYFTALTVPLSISIEGHGPYGTCPVYAAEIAFEDGRWIVTDRMFRTADAMLLSILSTGTADGALAPGSGLPTQVRKDSRVRRNR
jgi:hypothetical protein